MELIACGLVVRSPPHYGNHKYCAEHTAQHFIWQVQAMGLTPSWYDTGWTTACSWRHVEPSSLAILGTEHVSSHPFHTPKVRKTILVGQNASLRMPAIGQPETLLNWRKSEHQEDGFCEDESQLHKWKLSDTRSPLRSVGTPSPRGAGAAAVPAHSAVPKPAGLAAHEAWIPPGFAFPAHTHPFPFP